MRKPFRVLFVATYPPRACGIGTFTRDLTATLRREVRWMDIDIAAIDYCDEEHLDYPGEVVCRIKNHQPQAYAELACMANASDYDAICVQHEFGIFPGEWGQEVLNLYQACEKPIVTTLHTVIPNCPEIPRQVTRRIVRNSYATVVMARVGVDLLRNNYGVQFGNLKVIPHGVPAIPRVGEFRAKELLGLQDRDVISSFGLISRGKGVEYMIAAMPEIVRSRPNALYCVLGRTHPIVVRREGESYRDELIRMVETLRMQDHVRFVNKFLDDTELSLYLEATDVYVTPYLGAGQITSGTMARAIFCGKAIVSTPYLYACELLANGRGRLVAFQDSSAMAQELVAVLSDTALRAGMEASTRAYGRNMSWEATARQYARVFDKVALATRRLAPLARPAIQRVFRHQLLEIR